MDYFYILPYSEGGITRDDLEGMFESLQESKIEDLKFQARIHGCDPDAKEQPSEKGKHADDITSAHVDNDNVYEFGDKENGCFEGWTEEQKEEQSNNMLAQLRNLPI